MIDTMIDRPLVLGKYYRIEYIIQSLPTAHAYSNTITSGNIYWEELRQKIEKYAGGLKVLDSDVRTKNIITFELTSVRTTVTNGNPSLDITFSQIEALINSSQMRYRFTTLNIAEVTSAQILEEKEKLPILGISLSGITGLSKDIVSIVIVCGLLILGVWGLSKWKR